MERRDFLIGLGLASLASGTAIETPRPVDRKERLLIEGRMIAVRASRRHMRLTLNAEKTSPPTFPVGTEILMPMSLTPILLPDDALQWGDSVFDVCFGCWVAYFVHETFSVVPEYEHLPMSVYLKDHV